MMQSYRTVRRALTIGAFLSAAASAATAGDTEIVLHAKRAAVVKGAWSAVSDSTAAGGIRLANPDGGIAKLDTPSASPASYFELTFTPEAGRAYHLWMRSKAQNNSWTNDSVYVQFSGSLTSSGAATYRIGTTSAAMYSLEEDSGLGESGWGWQDNGFGLKVLGSAIYFDGKPQTIRVQAREDGISIDQIVLSAVKYASVAPGAGKNDATILPETTTTATATSITPTALTGNAVAWTSLVKSVATGGALQKTSGCGNCPDAGGVSLQKLTSGSVSFTVSSAATLVAGLNHDASSTTGYSINYSFKFSGSNTWEVRESGTYRTEGTFASSDVFKVAIEGTVVKYYRNSSLVYTSNVPVSGTYVVDATLVSMGAKVTATTDAAAPAPAPAPAPSPAPSPTSGTLRVLQWNTHHGGYGTDNVYDTNRVATWAATMKPDVIMFNEIEKYTSWGNQNQPEVYKTLLQQKTGKTWYYHFAQEFGAWSSNGKGNLILSTYPIKYTDRYELVYNADRSIAEVEITVNGRNISLILTHLDPYDQVLRLKQATEVTTWSASQPENRILTGDMNAWPDQTSIAKFNQYYNDSWAVAAAAGKAIAFSGNKGETKSGRIDYIFYSKGSANLTVQSSQVYDTRDANGVMPSDHRPVLTTFVVK
jgi:endonuclease/exonuclease/phosphatase family metal-dependent hydrolase